MFQKEYDVFLAYHGSYENGTLAVCERLNAYLKKRGLKTFFFPEYAGDNYIANITKAIRSETFLLVCNETIHTNDDGRMDIAKHYALSTEIDSFYAMAREEDRINEDDAKVLVCGNEGKLGGNREALLHELFAKRTHFHCLPEKEEEAFALVYDWIVARLATRKDVLWQVMQKSNEVSRVFFSRTAMTQDINLAYLLSSSKKILIAGVSNMEIAYHLDNVRGAVQNHKAETEIIFLNPGSPNAAAHELQEYGKVKGTLGGLINSCIEDFNVWCGELHGEERERVRLYTYDKLPRLNLIVLDNCAIVQYYAEKCFGGKSPCFYIERKGDGPSPIYDYCEKIFRSLKEISSEIEFES